MDRSVATWVRPLVAALAIAVACSSCAPSAAPARAPSASPSDSAASSPPSANGPASSPSAASASGSGAVAGATARPSALPRPAAAAPEPAPGAVESPAASGAPAAPSAPDRQETDTPTATSAIVPGTANRASIRMSATYDANLTLRFDRRGVGVDATLTATNNSGGPVDRVELNTVAARLGGMILTGVTVDGRAVTPSVVDQTIVVPLGGVLPAGSTTRIRVVYRAMLLNDVSGSNWLFAKANGIVNLYRWLPWISRPIPFDRPHHGDPFVTVTSPRVTVRITTDRPLVIAATGDRIAASGLTQTFEARNVRDFTVTAAPDFRTGSRVVGDTTVRVYYRQGFPAAAAVEAGAEALARMNALVGTYPYRTYKIVQSAGGYGMESPGLTWIPTGTASSNLTFLVWHETAHQWFYGLVSGDQAYEPFTDEAAADFLARYGLGLKRASRCATARLDLSIYQYSSSCYYEIIYIQGGNFLDDLRARMGSTAYWNALRAWLTANRHKLASTRSLLDTLDRYTPLDLVPRFEPRFPRLY